MGVWMQFETLELCSRHVASTRYYFLQRKSKNLFFSLLFFWKVLSKYLTIFNHKPTSKLNDA
jgi:hypothetical protein